MPANSPPPTSGLARLATRIFASVGPAIIVASIVLGPGSVLTSSKVGCEFGYSMLWVLAGAVVLMIGMTTLGAYLGATGQHTPCGELAARAGRPAAATIGVLVFVIIVCFQSTNNAAVLASLEGLASSPEVGVGAPAKLGTLLVLNGVIVVAMYGFRRLYRPLERLMMVLVLTMLVGFGINLAFASPSLVGIAKGFIPTLPAVADPSLPGSASLWPLLGLVATTYSVAGAFYQSYLVREKGWTEVEVRRGLVDSICGIALLGVVSAVVMITSAAALHGKVAPEELNSATAISSQLEPLFGSAAPWLFSCGIFAAAFSSFLGNALVGGTVLSDGLGLGSSIDEKWPKRLTVLALLTGMAITFYTTLTGSNAVDVIVVAQGLTVIGVPALAALMLWLGFRTRAQGHHLPSWILALASVGGLVTVLLAVRTVLRLME